MNRISKRLSCIVLSVLLMLSAIPAFASEDEFLTFEPTADEISLGGIQTGEPTHLNVGSMTHVNGAFFTSQFGNNTSDIDVRLMVHGYNTIVWTSQLEYVTDPQVVAQLVTTDSAEGTRTYTFTLADDLFWNDGTPVTARDYVFSYLLQASPEFERIGADKDIWSHFVGYEKYASGKTDCFEGVRLIDEKTFSVQVKAEYLPFFYELSMLSNYPYPIDVIAPGCEVEDTDRGARIVNEDKTVSKKVFSAELLAATVLDEENGYLSHPIKTCGPYNLTGYDAETGIVDFEINEYYKGNWEGVKPVITTVTLYPVKDAEIAEQMQNGEIDLVNKVVDGETLNALLALAGEGITNVPYARLGYGFVSFACEQGALQSQAVRQAIACCLDTDAFIEEYLQGYGVAVYGYYGIGQWMTQVTYGNLIPSEASAEVLAIWNGFNLDSLDHYDMDTDRALSLIIEDGWTLNSKGKPFTAGSDTMRYKKIDGKLVPLRFVFGRTEGNRAADIIIGMFETAFESLGAELVVETAPFTEILTDYFLDAGERKYDMSFLASNFVSRFDAVVDFYYDKNGVGTQNHSGIMDEELSGYTWLMHNTEPGDLTGYMQNWLLFQGRFNQLLPTLPIYSNVYMDFHNSSLQNYNLTDSEESWANAILYAYMLPAGTEEAEQDEEEDIDDIDDIFID